MLAHDTLPDPLQDHRKRSYNTIICPTLYTTLLPDPLYGPLQDHQTRPLTRSSDTTLCKIIGHDGRKKIDLCWRMMVVPGIKKDDLQRPIPAIIWHDPFHDPLYDLMPDPLHDHLARKWLNCPYGGREKPSLAASSNVILPTSCPMN